MPEVFTVRATEDEFIRDLRQQLCDADQNNNPDLHIEFKGYMHNRNGFKLRAQNLEVFDASLFDAWKSVVHAKGMECTLQNDLSNSWVNIDCKKVLRNRTRRSYVPSISLSAIPFTTIGYILLLVACIYLLWIRHSDKFQK